MAITVPERFAQYRVHSLVGQGAMGEVYEAVDESLGRRVALKVLGRKHQGSSEFKSRFLREGRALAAMNHLNVVQILGNGPLGQTVKVKTS